MEILIDDHPTAGITTAHRSVSEVACQALSQVSSAQEPRLVVALVCDGQPVERERLDEVLVRPAEQFKRLQFQTQPLRALTAGLIAHIKAAIGDAREIADRTADLLGTGDTKAGLARLQELLDAWKQIQEATQGYLQALATDREAEPTTAEALPELCARFKTLIGELAQAVSARDFVLVQDLLRYDLPETMDHWAEALAE